jgi:hypothetical protein
VFQWLCQHGSRPANENAWRSQADRRRLIAHTCIEATVRFAAELGYEVTMVRDATADYSDQEMHAALYINIPNYAAGSLLSGTARAGLAILRLPHAPVFFPKLYSTLISANSFNRFE